MINNYRLALRFLALAAVAFGAVVILISGSQEDMTWGQQGQIDTPSYAETLMKGHDCTPDGALPNAAIVTYKDEVAPIYTTNPKKVDAAFNQALGGKKDPNIAAVNALCID